MTPMLGFVLVAVTSPPPLPERAEIQRQYARWSVAARRNDVATIMKIISPDYTLTTASGTVITRKAYQLSLERRKLKASKVPVYTTHLAQLTEFEGKLIAISNEVNQSTITDPITNKRITLIHTHRYRDTWRKIATQWRLASTVTELESTTVAGPRATHISKAAKVTP